MKETLQHLIDGVNENFKFNLKLLRANEDIPAGKLSLSFGMSEKRIADLEGGRMPPNLEDLIKISDHYCISFDALLSTRISLSYQKNYKQ